MKYTKLICTLLVLVLSRGVYSQEKLEIEGAIIIKNSEAPAPVPGTIRYNPTMNDFEGWNGIYWASMTGNQYELGEMTDQEGNTYTTIIIGTQEWMASNLRTTKYRNGDPITLIGNDGSDYNPTWEAANYGAYCIYDTIGTSYPDYDVSIFGYLYNWFAVGDTRHLCPTGWHVPSGDDISSEWNTLTDFLGGTSVAGTLMQEAGTAHWNSPNQVATNSSGFTGLPGGRRDNQGAFSRLGSDGHWWSSTGSGTLARFRSLQGYNNVFSASSDKRYGYSVRCVRD